MQKDEQIIYRSPEVMVLEIKSQAIICRSGNEWSNEEDWETGGFSEL